MRQYSSDEIFNALSAEGGDAQEQAAAMVVITQAIIESRRLGRLAVRKPKNRWSNSPDMLRGNLAPGWNSRHNVD
jgi:hypothetical protein